MQKQILAELKELKSILAKLTGTSDLPVETAFSPEALTKAARHFQKMEAERGEWVSENDISKYVKSADWRAGKFIRTEFGFSAFIKQGYHYLYSKKHLLTLDKELKERNIDLKRYMEYKWDEADFKKKLTAGKKDIKGKRAYQLPAGLTDISTSPIPMPTADTVRADLNRLKDEFFQQKLAEYVDIYRGNHAMLKFMYHFEKYIDPQIKRRCKKWCDDFNYANHALELITKKKEVFVPVKEEEMIEL